MKKHLLLGLTLLFPFFSFGQFAFKKQTNIPVSEGTRQLKFPWTGGINNPQFSAADIDNNDTLDLVIFDRTGDKVTTFLNHGTSGIVDYTYNFEYESNFPPFIQWMLMVDFNCDGIDDVLTFHIGAIDYYKGSFDLQNRIEFIHVDSFNYDSHFSGILNIFVAPNDIPAIVDVNNDGDLDVLTFEQLGGVVDYFENQSQELTGTCGDTVFFLQASTCWGDFYERSTSNKVVLDDCGGFTKDSCIFFLKTDGEVSHSVGQLRHPGSTLMAYDEDGDGDKEVILGDVSFPRINRLINGGNQFCADIIEQDTAFPSYNVSYRNPIFPASFYVDVNNDSLKDLLVAPNAAGASENYSCSWYYKNVGMADSVVFDFQTDTFLVHDMLDFGEGAHPVFFDYNNDGLLDMVIGNYGYFVNETSYRTSLALLENIGSAQLPAYKLVDRDYENTSALIRKELAPAFGDMDNDGDEDMILGEFEGLLHYYENIAGAGNVANFTLSQIKMFKIDIGQFSTPFIYDINGDSLPDLLVGEKEGKINYFENLGTASAMVFDSVPTNSFFGRVDIRVPSFPNGYCAPVISRIDSSNKLYVLAGCEEGVIRVYAFDPDSIYSGSFRKSFLRYSDIDEGTRSSLTIADITGDGKFEMVVGNFRGGIAMYSQSDSILYPISSRDIKTSNIAMQVYPNPATSQVQIVLQGFKKSEPVVITLTDMLGRNLTEMKTSAERNTLPLPQVSSGMYFVKARQGVAIITRKLLITAE